MIDRDFILEMFNRMDDDFKKEHKTQLKSMLATYPCINLMKDDLIGYAENEYDADSETIAKMVNHLENLDDRDMELIADDFANDSVMDSFWCFIEYQLDLIKEKLK
jgi:hypothetical protein